MSRRESCSPIASAASFSVNGDDGYPYAIPVNYFFDPEHDKIYFHGAKAGHKVDTQT